MAEYSSAADHYAWGDGNVSPPWYAPEQPSFSLRAPDATAEAWGWFALAADVLTAASITSATLTISGLASPSTGSAEVTVHGGESSDEHLPLDHDEAVGRTLTTASATASLNGQTTVNIDVASIINELRAAALTNEAIQIRLSHPTNNEAGLAGLTLSLVVEYTPGDASFVETDMLGGSMEWQGGLIEYDVSASGGSLIWQGGEITAVTVPLADLPGGSLEWQGGEITAVTVPLADLPGGSMEWQGGGVEYQIDIAGGSVEWQGGEITAVTVPLADLPGGSVEWRGGEITAVTVPLADLPGGSMEWRGGELLARTYQPIVPVGAQVLPVSNRFEPDSGAALYLGPPDVDDPTRIEYRRVRPLPAGRNPGMIAASDWPDPESPLLHDAARAIVENPEDSIELDLPADYLPADGETTVFWAQVRTHSRGLENSTLWRPVRIVIDDAGDIVGAIGGRAVITQVEKRDAGGVRIGWDWFPAAHGSQPVTFELRRTSGPTAVATVSTPVLGQTPHAADIAGLQDEGDYTFALVAVADDAEEVLATIEFTADSSGPPAAESLSIEAIQ